MTPLLTKWREQEELFDAGCNADNISDPPTDTVWIKSHHRQSLIAIIEGEIERLRELGKVHAPVDGQCEEDCDLCDGYNTCLVEQISYYQSTLEGLRK